MDCGSNLSLLRRGGDPATHVDLCGVMRFESMKAAFEVWIGKWSQKLVSELCLLYNKYRMDDGAGNTMMIALIADMLTPTNLNIPVNSFAVATILLTDGYLERLCGG